jgi:hypothetical protein
MSMFRRSKERDIAEESIDLDLAEFEKLKCVHCGGAHLRACPRVKRMTFHNDKSLQEVEFWPAGQWPTENIIWPEDIMEEENAD